MISVSGVMPPGKDQGPKDALGARSTEVASVRHEAIVVTEGVSVPLPATGAFPAFKSTKIQLGRIKKRFIRTSESEFNAHSRSRSSPNALWYRARRHTHARCYRTSRRFKSSAFHATQGLTYHGFYSGRTATAFSSSRSSFGLLQTR